MQIEISPYSTIGQCHSLITDRFQVRVLVGTPILFAFAMVLFSFSACAEPYHGTASWYDKGKITANGKKFDANKYTVAHRTLPFGTLLKITNVKNGNTIEAIVSDRGPFVKNKEIDVSSSAAKALGFFHSGTTKVLIEVLDNRK